METPREVEKRLWQNQRWHGDDGNIHQIHHQGETLVWTILKPPSRQPIPGSRNPCTTFSRASRLAMYKFLNRVQWSAITPASFVTLTYPDGIRPTSKKLLNTHRYLIHRHLESYSGNYLSVIWRIEWEDRKSGKDVGAFYPHHHLMVMRAPFVPWQEVREWWRQIIGHDQGPLSTRVEKARNAKECGKYIAKYLAKSSLDIAVNLNSGIPTGRRWGVLRKSNVPMCKATEWSLPASEITDDMLEFAQRCLGAAEPLTNSFTLLGNSAKLLAAKLSARLSLTRERNVG